MCITFQKLEKQHHSEQNKLERFRAPTSKQRRALLALAAAACISPSVLFSQPAKAGWPWLLRFLGMGTARRAAGKRSIRRLKKELSYQKAMSTAYEGAELLSMLSGGGLLFGTTRTNLAATAGLHQLIYGGNNVTVPEARVARSVVYAAQLPILDTDNTRAVNLIIPPLAKGIHDNIAWGAVDVLNGDISLIRKCPLTINASATSNTLELPLGNLSVYGPHKFIAVLEKHVTTVPIFSTSVMEVI